MTIAPTKPATVQKITLEQWQTRASVCKKAFKELIILWFENNLGTQKELAGHLQIAPSTVSEHKAKLIASGKLTGVAMVKTKPKKKDSVSESPVENSDSGSVAKGNKPVKNSDSDVEEVTVVVDEPAASSTAIEQPAPKVKRPKELANMLDTHQKYIKDRLLPIAQKLAALHEEVRVEQTRLHNAWVKDNLVFTQPYQRCVDYWNEREMFGEFAKALDDPMIKTYADVLAAIRVKFRRCSERMETLEYSTGCIADPNKRDLRI